MFSAIFFQELMSASFYRQIHFAIIVREISTRRKCNSRLKTDFFAGGQGNTG